MTINNRIKNLRLNKSLSQKELSEKLDISVVTVQNWESGNKNPSMSAIIKLSNFYNISADYILGINSSKSSTSMLSNKEQALLSKYRALDIYGKEIVDSVCSLEYDRMIDSYNEVSKEDIRTIPLYSLSPAAGLSAPFDDNDYTLIPYNADYPKADFAVKINGESMSPYISDRETVFVQKTHDLKNGDVGIFSVDGAMYCKQYFIDKEKNLHLLSANPEYKFSNIDISYDSDSSVVCFGKVLLKTKLPIFL